MYALEAHATPGLRQFSTPRGYKGSKMPMLRGWRASHAPRSTSFPPVAGTTEQLRSHGEGGGASRQCLGGSWGWRLMFSAAVARECSVPVATHRAATVLWRC